MQQLFGEILILLIAVTGILITVFQIFSYRTERKLYYKIINIKDKQGKSIDIIVSADDYDEKLEEAIKKTVSTYYLKKSS